MCWRGRFGFVAPSFATASTKSGQVLERLVDENRYIVDLLPNCYGTLTHEQLPFDKPKGVLAMILELGGDVRVAEIGDEILLLDRSGSELHRLSGDATEVIRLVQAGLDDTSVPDRLGPTVNRLMAIGIIAKNPGWSRRRLLLAGAGGVALAGITSFALAAPAAAASPACVPCESAPTGPTSLSAGTVTYCADTELTVHVWGGGGGGGGGSNWSGGPGTGGGGGGYASKTYTFEACTEYTLVVGGGGAGGAPGGEGSMSEIRRPDTSDMIICATGGTGASQSGMTGIAGMGGTGVNGTGGSGFAGYLGGSGGSPGSGMSAKIGGGGGGAGGPSANGGDGGIPGGGSSSADTLSWISGGGGDGGNGGPDKGNASPGLAPGGGGGGAGKGSMMDTTLGGSGASGAIWVVPSP